MKILTIIPVYNRESTIEDAIKSVINQSHTDWVLIIVDDCSTDKTLEICKKYEYLYNVYVFSNEENLGCYQSRNRALYEAKKMGIDWDFHTIHDSDDFSHEHRFRDCVEAYKQNPESLVIKMSVITSNQRDLTFKIYNSMIQDTYYADGVVFINKSVFNQLGYYDDTRFAGDTEYLDRIKRLPGYNKSNITNVKSNSLYIAYSGGKNDNLTKTYVGKLRSEYVTFYKRRNSQKQSENELYMDKKIEF